jgi:glutamate-ammonia-ligase adenylyltransferase
MRENLDTKSAEKFDLKQSAGGIVDIEFMVQFGILANAEKSADLTIYTDNIRLLESLQKQNVISEHDAKILKSAYCAYRDIGHKQVLQGDKAIIEAGNFVDLREQVTQIWNELMLNPI